MAKYYTISDVLVAIRVFSKAMHAEDCTTEEFDRSSDQLLRMVQKLIFKCLGNVHEARKRLREIGYEEVLDVYLEFEG